MVSKASLALPPAWADFLQSERVRLERLGLRRSIETPDGRSGVRACIEGRDHVLFTSNDYLGLSLHPKVMASGNEAAVHFGTGAGSARLLHGSTPLHDELQNKLAVVTRQEAALLFSSGYMANIGVLSSLADGADAIFYDNRSHASIIDGAKLSQAALIPYRHNDAAALEDSLRGTQARRRIVVTESLFSMDGDWARLEELKKMAVAYDALLVVDEAHAIGVWGEQGAGLVASATQDSPVVIVGTLSKALGSIGGFVAGPRPVIDHLINRARTFVFDTALPASAVAAASKALDLASAEPWRRQKIEALSARLRSGLEAGGYLKIPARSQVVPLILGKPQEALAAEGHFRAHGILARAVRPPTVPRGTSRIRFSVTAAHEEHDIDKVLSAVRSLRG